ncbi:MAG TPA: hypothetical protein DCE41_06485 [Cytophagales bacterium]|nr:hypothetical protein [Cytophagales bacterium]HAA19094.1 hypothetical protein [Cytophagales bacterium]HAP59487.1 hypothetical protein [Cytophagales bacterium]
MISSTHDIQGKLTLQRLDPNGNVLGEQVTHNSITTQGRKLVSDLFKFNILTEENQEDKIKRISQIHVGRSKAAFKPDQTGLQDEVGKTPIQSVEYVATGNERIQLRLVGELGMDDANDKLQEAGLFTEDETPIMYNRVIFDTITKSPEFKLKLIWELTF